MWHYPFLSSYIPWCSTMLCSMWGRAYSFSGRTIWNRGIGLLLSLFSIKRWPSRDALHTTPYSSRIFPFNIILNNDSVTPPLQPLFNQWWDTAITFGRGRTFVCSISFFSFGVLVFPWVCQRVRSWFRGHSLCLLYKILENWLCGTLRSACTSLLWFVLGEAERGGAFLCFFPDIWTLRRRRTSAWCHTPDRTIGWLGSWQSGRWFPGCPDSFSILYN